MTNFQCKWIYHLFVWDSQDDKIVDAIRGNHKKYLEREKKSTLLRKSLRLSCAPSRTVFPPFSHLYFSSPLLLVDDDENYSQQKASRRDNDRNPLGFFRFMIFCFLLRLPHLRFRASGPGFSRFFVWFLFCVRSVHNKWWSSCLIMAYSGFENIIY